MEELKTLNFINGLVDKEVNIILKNGTIYRGKLKSFDIHTNIVLENCEEVKQGKTELRERQDVISRNHFFNQLLMLFLALYQ